MPDTKTTERLIDEAIELQKQRTLIDMQISNINMQLEERFPAQRTREMLLGNNGYASRIVTNNWAFKPGCLAEVRRILGVAYAHMLHPEYPMTPTQKIRDLVRDPRSDVGRLLKMHIVNEQTVLYRYREHNSTTVVSDGPTSEIVDLADLPADEV